MIQPFLRNSAPSTAHSTAGITAFDWAGLLLVSFVLPTVLCAVLGALFRKKGWIKDGDLKLD